MGRYSTGGAEALAAKRWGGAPLRTARVWCRFNAAHLGIVLKRFGSSAKV